jgi:hypothetical protein
MKVRSAIISLVEDGAEWLITQSKTLVKNLNAEYLGGKRFDQYCRKKVFSIGDGESTSFLLDHNLDCDFFHYSLINEYNKKIEVEHDIEVINKNSMIIRFTSHPIQNQFKLIIIG